MRADRIAGLAGLYGLAMVLGALGFQYIGHVLPCEMCHWQRWPLDGAFFIGVGAAALSTAGILDKKAVTVLALIALGLIAISGSIGAYQAGVEWKLLPGPSSCTGARFVFHGAAGLSNMPPVVPCDVASWRLFGISLAGYNALCSLGAAFLGAVLLLRRKT